MTAQWLSFGQSRWYLSAEKFAAADYQWRASPDPTTALQYMRFGDPAALQAAAGKVLRGWRIRHAHIRGGIEAPVRIYGFYLEEGAFPQPDYSFPRTNTNADFTERTSYVEDAGRPLGKFSTDPSRYHQSSVDWPGLFTYGPVRQLRSENGGGTTPLFRIVQFEGLVDDAPSWAVSGNNSVLQGETTQYTVNLRWPDNTPIPDEAIRLVGGNRTSVRVHNGNTGFDTTATAYTNSEGRAYFDVRGDAAGADVLKVYLQDVHRAGLYNPRFEKDLSITVTPPVSNEPPTPVCVDVPGTPAIPGIPPRTEATPIFEWNSGANSIEILDGDVRVAFNMPPVIGVILGFTQDRENVTSRTRMTHAFFFSQAPNGTARFQVIESGTLRTATAGYNNTTQFEVWRVAGEVTYRVDGRIVYVSRVRSEDALSVGVALYATGDRAP